MAGLRQLLVDLGKSASLHDEYVEGPEAVMAKYKLSQKEIDAMLAKDIEEVKRLSGMDNLKSNSTISAHDQK
jgi:hypothetical protein